MNLLSDAELQRLKQRYTMPVFAEAVAKLRTDADTQMSRPLNIQDEGGWWTHNYTCPTHATRLIYDRDKPHEHVCEVDGEVFSGGVYDEAWRSFRNSELIRSAHAAALVWAMSGEGDYHDHAAQVLAEYAKRYASYPVHGKNAGQGRVMGQSLDEAVWSIPAAWAYDAIRDGLDDEQRSLIETELLRGLGDHLLTQLWTRIHNIQCWHLAGLATLGVVLDEERYIQPIFEPNFGFEAQVREGVLDDGWWWEGSPHYHFYTTQAMTSLAMAVRYRHPELLDNPRFQRMFSAPLEMLRPDLSLPSLNDGWINITWPGGMAQYVHVYERVHGFWGDPLYEQMMARVYAEHGERNSADALLFGPETLPAPETICAESLLHPTSGYAVLKSDDTQLLLKYGPHGGGHGHPDKLALVLWGYGQRLSADLGTPGYGIPMNNSWYRHTLAHNTILLDGERQPPATGQLLRFEPNGDAVTVADAEVTWLEDGLYEGVKLRRCILWKAGYFVDIVRVICPEVRQIDLAWHCAGTLDFPEADQTSLQFDTPGYQHLSNIRETQADQWRAVWRTATDPGVQQWALNPENTLTLVADAPFNPASEIMSLVIRRVSAAEVVFVSVVEPFAKQHMIGEVVWDRRDDGVTIQVNGDEVADHWDIRWAEGEADEGDSDEAYIYRLDG